MIMTIDMELSSLITANCIFQVMKTIFLEIEARKIQTDQNRDINLQKYNDFLYILMIICIITMLF
jgi:hypothetical protein